MISLAAVGSAGDAASYYAKDNYYTADEAHGASAWAGQGAAELGLSGPVETGAFEAVLRGELPDGSVLEARRGEHRPGWDLTFSASKSVSLTALVGGDKRLVDALRTSVTATLAWAERNIAEARVWNGQGQQVERTGKLVAATFLHDVSRNGDPQLHIHAVVANATRTADGKWRALHPDELYNRQTVLGAVFNAELRSRVEQLGYETTSAKNPVCGAFEIAGIGREAIEAFSTRSVEIGAALAAEGRGSARERELTALSTRQAKTPELSPEMRGREWGRVAASVGLNLDRLVTGALERAGHGETMWGRVVEGVRGAGEKGKALAARMGLTPRDGDPLVPERLGRLDPKAYAVAEAVASAGRDLGEREAAFDRLQLLRSALECGGPITVADVEARIAALQAKGLLIGDGERMVTTEGAVRLEQRFLDGVAAGKGSSAPIVEPRDAAVRAQEAARELGLRRLNPGQVEAAVLMLSSRDRVVNVQGGPGRGKSAALAPVAAIAKGQGRAVLGLAIASRTARALGNETGSPASTIAGFLGRHERVIDGTASPSQLERAQAELRGTFLIVDEASQVGTYAMERLVRLANAMEVGRLALVGDTRQLGAVEQGKPFELAQAAGHATAQITENLRSSSEQMKAVTAALDKGDVAGAFAVLKPATVEVERGQVAHTAARMWAALPKAERDDTLLLASGRAMRTAANAEAQVELKKLGEIAPKGVRMEVLDRVTVTREGARQMKAYAEGRVVEFRTDLRSQGFGRGDRGTVVGLSGERVRLRMASGKEREFEPGKLPRNLRHDAVSIHAVKSLELHAGDRIRWTDNDRERGLANADLARVEQVGKSGVTVSSLADGTVHELKAGDRMLERLDLAYAINVHVAQGVTARHGIVAMSSAERLLSNEKAFLVAMTRIADKATLVVDSGQKLERAVTRNPGEKTSALETAGKVGPLLVGTADSLRVFPKEELAMMHAPWPEKGLELGL
jgi:conjugative relaxase-like TrwC/TraI family protein